MSRKRAHPRSSALRASIARSVDAPVSLLPHFDLLFRGIESLGGVSLRAVNLLRGYGVGPVVRVVDLACGKGHASVLGAARAGWRITGVDACGEFLASAAQRAKAHGVSGRCRFIEQDVRVFAARRSQRGHFAAGMMLGLFPAVEAAGLLRVLVRPGGVYLVDDAFKNPRHAKAGMIDAPTLREAATAIGELGDHVLSARLIPKAHIASMNRSLFRRLNENAAVLAAEHPGLRRDLKRFLASQKDANRLLLGPLRPGLLAVRKEGART